MGDIRGVPGPRKARGGLRVAGQRVHQPSAQEPAAPLKGRWRQAAGGCSQGRGMPCHREQAPSHAHRSVVCDTQSQLRTNPCRGIVAPESRPPTVAKSYRQTQDSESHTQPPVFISAFFFPSLNFVLLGPQILGQTCGCWHPFLPF